MDRLDLARKIAQLKRMTRHRLVLEVCAGAEELLAQAGPQPPVADMDGLQPPVVKRMRRTFQNDTERESARKDYLRRYGREFMRKKRAKAKKQVKS